MENDHPGAANEHVQEPVARSAGKARNGRTVATVATVVVVGVGAALISPELLLGVLIGAAAALLPGVRGNIRPLFEKTVRAGNAVTRMTREMVAEAKAGDVPPVPVPGPAAETTHA